MIGRVRTPIVRRIPENSGGERLGQVEITLNGESRTVPQGITVAELIATLELQPKFVAVERNLQVVPQAQHAQCRLAPGDRIEIVTLVGGG